MAENLTIARPYAQAVFEIARDDKSFESWSLALEAMACAVKDEQFSVLLKKASSSQQASQMLVELLSDLLDEKIKNFVFVLGENDRFEVLPEIYQEFKRLQDDYLKVKEVELITARPLDAKDEKALAKKLEEKYQSTIRISKTIDPSILGGMIIKVGDEVIDASVKSSLSSLSSTLK